MGHSKLRNGGMRLQLQSVTFWQRPWRWVLCEYIVEKGQVGEFTSKLKGETAWPCLGFVVERP